jgi:hypothetical protein
MKIICAKWGPPGVYSEGPKKRTIVFIFPDEKASGMMIPSHCPGWRRADCLCLPGMIITDVE